MPILDGLLDGNKTAKAAQLIQDERTPPHDKNLNALKEETQQLQEKLATLRRRRRRVQELREECQEKQSAVYQRLNRQLKTRQEGVDAYTGTLTQRYAKGLFLEYGQRWSVLNDCFHIWHSHGGGAAFATINGCRLGSQASALPANLLASRPPEPSFILQQQQQQQSSAVATNVGRHQQKQRYVNGTDSSAQPLQSSTQPQQQRRYLGLFPGRGGNEPSNGADSFNNNATAISSPKRLPPNPTGPTRVPWHEVNAALGHACLVLKILQEESTLQLTHELHPMGATSKIGIRFYNPKTVTTRSSAVQSVIPVVYNLYFEESSGFSSLFRNDMKNFNLALQAFCQCVAEAAAQHTDKTIAIPHVIRHVVPGKQSNSASVRNGHLGNGNSLHSNGGGDGRPLNNNGSYNSSYPLQNNNLKNPNTNFLLNGGEWTVGGVSICYPSTTRIPGVGGDYDEMYGDPEKVEWTRACKYLLTDLKWLVASATKHVGR